MATPQPIEPIETMPTPVLADFAGLYERHYEAVYRAALRVTGRPADAEDVLQTVFPRVLSQREHEQAAARPSAYFRRAAVNAAVDLLRRRAVHAEAGFDDAAPPAAVEPALLLKELCFGANLPCQSLPQSGQLAVVGPGRPVLAARKGQS